MTYGHSYDVTPGGERLLSVATKGPDADQVELRFVLGWYEEGRAKLVD